ncbi:(2Fe-2S)-binding protein [Virgibacillus necropolis]|uniref:(2Fe-2S)-binding protein n=1 Tax=Virgibacillus necropolis TaxID=163877 RepID=UPI00384E6D15
MDKSTIVCRCEEINIDEIESAIKMGAHTFDDIKRITRCGMGPCQAKVCTNLMQRIINELTNKPLSDIGPSKMRMPLRITRIGALAGGKESSSVISVFNESAPKEGEANND